MRNAILAVVLIAVLALAGCGRAVPMAGEREQADWNERQPGAGPGNFLYFASDEGNPQDHYDLWRLDMGTGQRERLTNVGDIVYHAVSPREEVIAVNRRGTIYLFKPADNQWQELGRGKRPQWDPSGAYLLDTNLSIIEVAGGRAFKLEPEQAPDDDAMAACWYPGGRRMVVSYRHEGLFIGELGDWQAEQGVVKVRMTRMLPERTAGGSFGALAVNPAEDVVAFIAGANGYRWIFTTYYEGGAPYLYDSYENKDLPENEEKAESEYTLSWSSDGQRLYFHKIRSGAAHTALYFLEPNGMVSPVARDGNS